MARGRMISKSISISRKLGNVSMLAKLIYTWTIPHTDDFGRMEGDFVGIKATVIPLVQTTGKDIEKALKELEKQALIERYEVGGQKYLEIIGFDEHQTFKNDRPRRPKFPMPPNSENKQRKTPPKVNWNPTESNWKKVSA